MSPLPLFDAEALALAPPDIGAARFDEGAVEVRVATGNCQEHVLQSDGHRALAF